MKKVIQALLLSAVAAGVSGCATPYMVDRRRDAADIFTATAGIGVGAKGRVGPLQAGIFYNQDKLGLRGGCLSRFRNKEPPPSYDFDSFVVPGVAGFDAFPFGPSPFGYEIFVHDQLAEAGRNKAFWACKPLPFLALTFPVSQEHFHYYTELELALGLGPTLRLGFNPGELLDFILGWATVDIFNDDVEAGKRGASLSAPLGPTRAPRATKP